MYCRADPKGHLKFNLINLNSTSKWFTEINGDAEDVLAVKNVTQLDKDTILVCYESKFSTVFVVPWATAVVFCKFNFHLSVRIHSKSLLLVFDLLQR